MPDLDRNKRTVVFLHALCTNASAWDTQMADPRLNQSYNLVTFDGESALGFFGACLLWARCNNSADPTLISLPARLSSSFFSLLRHDSVLSLLRRACASSVVHRDPGQIVRFSAGVSRTFSQTSVRLYVFCIHGSTVLYCIDTASAKYQRTL